MKRVLFIAYHFPPHGGAGAQRSTKFVKHLPELGWQPVVVTAPASEDEHWRPLDVSLERDVVGSDVIHVAGSEIASVGQRSARLRRLAGLRRPFASWWVDAVVDASEAAGPVDAIVASGSPFESFDAAERLAVRLGVPWIADLRDPWALDEMTVYPTGIHQRVELRRMRRVLATADAIVMNTNEATRRLHELRGLADHRIVTIPNGFDPSDFAVPPQIREGSSFRVVHAGYLHTELGRRAGRLSPLRTLLGGRTSGLDIGTRSHAYLLDALDRAAASGAGEIEVYLAGVATPADRALGEGRRFPVRMPGYLAHERAVELMRSADLLFLPMHDLPAGTRASIVPGKTYEYLASGRPILAAVPDGDARDLLDSAEGVILCRPSDVESMTAASLQLVREWRAHGTPTIDRSDILAPFTRRALTARLAALLDDVTSGTART